MLQRLGIYEKAPSKKKGSEPIKVKTIQTDNGFKFTNRLNWQVFLKNKKTKFEKTLEELGIEYKVIKPHTPKQTCGIQCCLT